MGKRLDIQGNKFNMLTAKRFSHVKNNRDYWECKCDCGKTHIVERNNLIRGAVKSCGCLRRRKENLAGERFGRLVVTEISHIEGDRTYWKCKCDCGNTTVTRTDNLTCGEAKSCGCLQRDVAKSQTVHGYSRRENKSPEYSVWQGITDRCTNPNNPRYKNYGGRGIALCEEWHDFTVFLRDMGKRPSKKHEIDRIDNDKGYHKENCRWVTRKQNNYNKGANLISTSKYKGVCYDKSRNKWKAQLTYKGQAKLNKRYNTEKEAARAYNEAAIKYFGEYAYLNKIE